jgi:gas vesicle protein
LDEAYKTLKLNQKERDQWDFKAKLDEMLTAPDRTKQIQRERTELRKNIERLEQEINRMETNLAFFARSKGADSLRAEVASKVQVIQGQIDVLKQRIKLLPNE